ncbi:unnamed protein product [Darwinula stevensoni]|uniref:Proteasome subunit beta n=1 Tax=Darwinula stevensoni TaxID=69355 RepID=A0A7R8X8C8_9CRUS|nr:unnamed protein product [Darwinula stevensoni]CAG0883284.1 unnamed protein product [Darwinula stevensoni]
MECLIGIQFKDYILLAADMNVAHSIIMMKHDEEKIYKLGSKLAMAVSGEPGDTTQFAEYIAKNLQLYKMRNEYELSPAAASSFIRRNMAESLRSRTPYYVNLMIGGYDDTNGPELYYADYLATLVKVPFAAHGYGGFFSMSVIDRYYQENMSVEEGYELMKKCVKEVQKRLIVNMPNFQVNCISKDGLKSMEPITAEKLAAVTV